MRKKIQPIVCFIISALFIAGCAKHADNALKRKMIPLAKQFLKEDNITNYNNLEIKCVDTITELAYAKLCSELLGNMEMAYEEKLYDENANKEVVSLYVNEIVRTRQDMENLIDDGELQSEGVLLYMVTGSYKLDNKDNEFIFMVNPDKKTLHILDPFGDNLLYKE